MPIPDRLRHNLSLPLIAAPMFIVSYPELVIAQCKAGVVGSFPSLNARTLEQLDEWLSRIEGELAGHAAAHPDQKTAPHAVNLILEKSNSRLIADIGVVIRHKVPLVITSVGPPGQVVEVVHGYGGLVFHDVTNLRHARKAIEHGVDGLILVAAGAGGHAGTASPFALIAEVRRIWDGPIVLAGAITDGRQIRAAQMMGADLAYMGTRFIATEEANAPHAYKAMLVEDSLADLVYTPAFSGIPANYLRRSIEAAGIDPAATMMTPGAKDRPDLDLAKFGNDAKAWKDIWSAGQGIGSIDDIPTVAELVNRLRRDYAAATLPVWPGA